MLSSVILTIPLVPAALGLLIPYTTQLPPQPFAGESLIEYVAENPLNTSLTGALGPLSNLSSNGANIVQSNPTYKLTGPPSQLTSRGFRFSPQQLLTATWNSSGNGYNITLDSHLCASTVIGDFTAPSGELVQNASLADIYNKLKLPSPILSNYLFTQVQTLQEKFNASITNAICPENGHPDRELRFDRYTAEQRDGYWTTMVLNVVGGSAIAFVGLDQALSHNLTTHERAGAIVGAGAVEAILYSIMNRLQKKQYISPGEAMILNVFVMAGNGAQTALRITTCATATAFMAGYQGLQSAAARGAQIFTPSTEGVGMSAAGSSAADLVGEQQC